MKTMQTKYVRYAFCYIILWRDIEVVITGLTRNQFVRKHTRVRIPLSPPKNKKHPQQRVLLVFCENINRDSNAVNKTTL